MGGSRCHLSPVWLRHSLQFPPGFVAIHFHPGVPKRNRIRTCIRPCTKHLSAGSWLARKPRMSGRGCVGSHTGGGKESVAAQAETKTKTPLADLHCQTQACLSCWCSLGCVAFNLTDSSRVSLSLDMSSDSQLPARGSGLQLAVQDDPTQSIGSLESQEAGNEGMNRFGIPLKETITGMVYRQCPAAHKLLLFFFCMFFCFFRSLISLELLLLFGCSLLSHPELMFFSEHFGAKMFKVWANGSNLTGSIPLPGLILYFVAGIPLAFFCLNSV